MGGWGSHTRHTGLLSGVHAGRSRAYIVLGTQSPTADPGIQDQDGLLMQSSVPTSGNQAWTPGRWRSCDSASMPG